MRLNINAKADIVETHESYVVVRMKNPATGEPLLVKLESR